MQHKFHFILILSVHVQPPAYYSDRLWCTLYPHSGSGPFQLITFNAPPSVSTRIPNSRLVCLILQHLKSPYAWWIVNFNLQTLNGTISSHYLSLKPHTPFIFFFLMVLIVFPCIQLSKLECQSLVFTFLSLYPSLPQHLEHEEITLYCLSIYHHLLSSAFEHCPVPCPHQREDRQVEKTGF